MTIFGQYNSQKIRLVAQNLYMKKTLHFTLLIAILLITGLNSCKKESNNDTSNGSEYYLKFKKNGNWITWKNALCELGADLDDNTKTDFGFQGASDDNAEGFGISFQVEGASIPQGTYHSDDYFMPIDYTISQNNHTTWYSDHTSGEPASSYSVTLSSINSTTIKGSFTGNFLVNDDDDADKLNITEGEFFLKRIR